MKTIILNSDISEEKSFILSKIFANKLPLFDFINSFFGYINYGYQIIDGRVNVLKLNNRVMVIWLLIMIMKIVFV